MRILTLDECKKISLDILIDIADYCEKNNLRYFLSVGTLLGAIRHKGYIPWDDDIDIMMPRPDYKKLIENYDGKYAILKPSTGMLYYAKAYDKDTIKYEPGTDYKKYKPIGVDIDIFPLDGMVNDKQILDKLYKRDCFLEALLRLSNQPILAKKNPVKIAYRILARIIGSKNLVKMIEANAQTYDYDSSDYVVRMRYSPNGFTGALKKEVYEKDYGEFEGHRFVIPKGYDTFLKAFFGEGYMSLPKPEDRVTHEFECYRIEENEN